MFWYITIILVLMAIFVLILTHNYKERISKDQPGIIWFIYTTINGIISAAIVAAVAFAISGYQHYQNEDRILNDILINGTPPVVEFKVGSDTVLRDTYWYAPGDESGIRYPMSRGSIDKE